MRDKIKILTLSADLITLDEWQQRYGLTVGSTQIGKHFSYQEWRFNKDLQTYGELIVNEPLMMVMDETSRLRGRAVKSSSFNRSGAFQKELKASDPRVSHLRAEVSTHEHKIASDLDAEDEGDTIALAAAIEQAAKNKNIKVRIGFEDYLEQMHIEKKAWDALPEPKDPFDWPWTFVHVDTGPEYFAKGKPWHHLPHPEPWEREARW